MNNGMPAIVDQRMNERHAFTWGYWGWGNESRHFVEAVDRLEKRRGYEPPVFVDLRFSRGGRAANFKANAFAEIVGPERYRWMPQLGNKRIGSKRGPPIQIADPAAASTLLEHIDALQRANRRLIMFCACARPWLKLDNGYPACHRVSVATLLLRLAEKRRLPLTIAEWPGSAAASLALVCDPRQIKALTTRAKYIPIGALAKNPPHIAVLGWGSIVRFNGREISWTVVTGPAYARGGEWRIQVMNDAYAGASSIINAETAPGHPIEKRLRSTQVSSLDLRGHEGISPSISRARTAGSTANSSNFPAWHFQRRRPGPSRCRADNWSRPPGTG